MLACISELESYLQPLGFSRIRSAHLIKFSNMHLIYPPNPHAPYKLRVLGKKYPATLISHYPGVGRYCLDSYLIFHVSNGWPNVRPLDKELRAYVVSGCTNQGSKETYAVGVGPRSRSRSYRLHSVGGGLLKNLYAIMRRV
jgi:hypothetical protein